MAKFTNTAEGPRGIILKGPKDEHGNHSGGDTVWIDPGQTVDVEDKEVHHAHHELEKGEAAAKKAAAPAEDEAPSA